MKKTVLTLLLCIGSSILAMETEKSVQFPSAVEIEQHLAAEKIPAHVTQKLKLSKALANKRLLPAEILIAVETRFSKYIEKIEDTARREKVQAHLTVERSRLFSALLKEHPEALESVTQIDNAYQVLISVIKNL